jgi:hypothetical protein
MGREIINRLGALVIIVVVFESFHSYQKSQQVDSAHGIHTVVKLSY